MIVPVSLTGTQETDSAEKFHVVDITTMKTEVLPCFKFKIPLSEFGINSDRVMEMVIECEERFSYDHYHLGGHAWARESGDTVSGYLGSYELTTVKRIAPEDHIKCLLDAICNDSYIRNQLKKYIATLDQV